MRVEAAAYSRASTGVGAGRPRVSVAEGARCKPSQSIHMSRISSTRAHWARASSCADAGATWTPSRVGLGGHKGVEVETVATNPRSSQIVYAGTCDGVFKSTNRGESWSAVNVGLASTDVRTLAIDPLEPETLFAGIWGYYHASTTTHQPEPGGVFKTMDGGETWVALDTVLADDCGRTTRGRLRIAAALSLAETSRASRARRQRRLARRHRTARSSCGTSARARAPSRRRPSDRPRSAAD